MTAISTIATDQQTAFKIIHQLRCGIVPQHWASQLTVGRQDLIDHSLEKLRVAMQGGYKTLLLEGAYGQGKSHMLTVIGERVQSYNSAVIKITLEPHLEQSFHLPRLLFQKMLQVIQSEYPIAKVLEPLSHISDNFGSHDFFRHLQAVIQSCRLKQLSSLVILFDEVESLYFNITNPRDRAKAYQFFYDLLNPPDFLKHLMVVFAITPYFFDVISQDPQLEEMPKPIQEMMAKWRKQLPQTYRLKPFQLSDATNLSERLMLLHGRAYQWQPLQVMSPEQVHERLISLFQDNQMTRLPERSFVRQFIRMLDLLQQNYSTYKPEKINLKPPVMDDVHLQSTLDLLKQGKPPLCFLSSLTRQWEGLLEGQQDYLLQTSQNIHGTLRLVCAQKETGVSHFLMITREMALQMKFVVAYISFKDLKQFNLSILFQEVLKNLSASPLKLRSGLHTILKSSPIKDYEEINPFIKDELFKRTFKAYFGASNEKEQLEIINKLTLPAPNQAIHYFKQLITLLQGCHFKGLIILLDDIDEMFKWPEASCLKAYQVFRTMFDEMENFNYIHCLMGVTPEVLSSETGFKAYPALFERVREYPLIPPGQELHDNRDILVQLNLQKWDHSNYLELLKEFWELMKKKHSTTLEFPNQDFKDWLTKLDKNSTRKDVVIQAMELCSQKMKKG